LKEDLILARTHIVLVLLIAFVLGLFSVPLLAANLREASGEHPIPELGEDVMNDPERVAQGKEIWMEQCTHCHGAKAYPGKAPKLKPRIYTPEFVFERVTYGFRKMPPWEEVYDEDERISLVAWVMNRKFSP